MHTRKQPEVEPPERHADRHATGHGDQESGRDVHEGEAVGRGSADGEAVDQERTRIVQQAFALEDGEEAMRNTG